PGQPQKPGQRHDRGNQNHTLLVGAHTSLVSKTVGLPPAGWGCREAIAVPGTTGRRFKRRSARVGWCGGRRLARLANHLPPRRAVWQPDDQEAQALTGRLVAVARPPKAGPRR